MTFDDLLRQAADKYEAQNPQNGEPFDATLRDAFLQGSYWTSKMHEALLRQLLHSVQQALVPGNDSRRELQLMQSLLKDL